MPNSAAVSARDAEKSPLTLIAQLGFVAAAAVAVFSFVSVAQEGELRRRCSPTCLLKPTYAGYERAAPDFTLEDTKGAKVSLSSFRGKVVVLNFWTKTCGPCMEEMPEIADLARIVKPMGDVVVLTISTDETAKDASDTLRAVLREDAPFQTLMDPNLEVVKGKYGTSLYPETWIIDKNGVVRARFDGAKEWSNAAIVQMLDHVRGGGFCPIEVKDGKFVGERARLCDAINGG